MVVAVVEDPNTDRRSESDRSNEQTLKSQPKKIKPGKPARWTQGKRFGQIRIQEQQEVIGQTVFLPHLFFCFFANNRGAQRPQCTTVCNMIIVFNAYLQHYKTFSVSIWIKNLH
ncbi:hypothetical protein AMECASPLE_000850 [Ameca splendens]|uniref:Uncharacterized protein n=1 Tax=Ameca splendens TaxID=208324 RepID=A0ABV0YL30_9TELE